MNGYYSYLSGRLKKIKEAMQSLEQEAKVKAEAKRQEIRQKEQALQKEGKKRKGKKPKEPGDKPKKVSADTGYFSETNVEYLEDEQIDSYIATARQKHRDRPEPAGRGRIAKNATKQERMARKLRTKKGRETYSRRKQIVEPVFGQIKEVRGFRRFFLRGLDVQPIAH